MQHKPKVQKASAKERNSERNEHRKCEKKKWEKNGKQKREVVLYFKKLFQETSHCNPNCLVLDNIPMIDENLFFEDLLKPITIEEVKSDMFSMGPYKALGAPNGFLSYLLGYCW